MRLRMRTVALDRLRQRAALGCLLWALLGVATSGNDALPIGIDVQDCVVRFADEVEVPSLATGRVAEVFVANNQSVEVETRLARLDDRSLLIRRRSGQLRLELARSAAADEIELQYAETALAEAEAELDTSRTIHQDVSGAIPLSQLRRLRLAVQRGELEVARAKKRSLEAQTAVDLAEAELAVIDDQLQNLQIESPLAGTVLEVNKSAGEWVETGETIATIARLDRLHIHALLPSSVLPPEHCQGLSVSVHWVEPVSQAECSLRGRVLSVDPQVMPGGRYRLHAEVVNEPATAVKKPSASGTASGWKLRPGAEVRMKVYAPAGVAQRPRSTRAIGSY